MSKWHHDGQAKTHYVLILFYFQAMFAKGDNQAVLFVTILTAQAKFTVAVRINDTVKTKGWLVPSLCSCSNQMRPEQ